MSLVLWKFYGHLASIWNRLQSCRSYLWYQKPGKPNQSRLIICLLLDLTELSTLSTGSTATTQKVSKYISGVYIIFEWSIRQVTFKNSTMIQPYLFFCRLLWYHRNSGWLCTNHFVLRLLLPLHHQGPQRKETSTTSLSLLKPFWNHCWTWEKST